MKRTASRWFRNKSQVSAAANFAKFDVMSKTGASPENTTNIRQEDEDGNKFFIVGKSKVGEDYII